MFSILKPFIFTLDPEVAHDLAINSLKLNVLPKNLFKVDGFIIVDANKKEYTIGKPLKNPPIKLKLLDKSLHTKLLLLPDLYFGEAYVDGSAVIENGTLTEF